MIEDALSKFPKEDALSNLGNLKFKKRIYAPKSVTRNCFNFH